MTDELMAQFAQLQRYTVALHQLIAIDTARRATTVSSPGGRWPDPVTGSFSDATVTDGDADWSLAR